MIVSQEGEEQQENKLKNQNRYAKNQRLTIHDDLDLKLETEMNGAINVITILLCHI